MRQRCQDCHSIQVLAGRGNGKCSACYGGGKVGTIADDLAGGKRACPRCHGSGQCQTCGGSGVVSVPDKPRPRANAELNPFDDEIAVRTWCPNCGDTDWFEWKFLGKLTDPICGYTWYAGSGMYTMRQIRAIFGMAKKMVKYLSHGASGEGAWIARVLGGFVGVVVGIAFRLPFAMIMIPIQAIVRLSTQKSAGSSSTAPESDRAKAKSRSA